MFFHDWYSLLRTTVSALLAYPVLVLFLRFSGKRTLAKTHAFDLVITIALGSTLSSLVLSRQTSIADGLLAFALLIALQYAVAWGSRRAGWFSRLVRAEPALLYHRGQFLDDALAEQRVLVDEVVAAARKQGFANLDDVTAIVLETDGSFSVVSGEGDGRATTVPEP